MITATRLPAAAQRYRARGLWAGTTIGTEWQGSAQRCAARQALVEADQFLTYRDLADEVTALAHLLRRHGVGRGDVVTILLPTWWEAAAVFLAAQSLGAIANLLHLTYREREIAYVLEQTGSPIVFVCGRHGGTDYRALVSAAVQASPATPAIIGVRDGTPEWRRPAGEPLAPAAAATDVQPDDIAMLIFTSGTTANPKGVLHSHNTVLRCVADMRAIYELSASDRVFVPSPVSHVAGLMFVLAALLSGGTAVLLDAWNEDRALDLVLEHGCTFAGGALPFIRGLVQAVRRRGLSAGEIPVQRGNCGAADVPPQLIADADRTLGAPFSRGYGLTEGIVVSVCGQRESFEHRAKTDGRIVPAVDVRLVSECGRDVAEGQAGEVLVRGPQNFVGYLDPTDNDGAFADGDWFRTGDLARLVDGGYLVIVGRVKEMISRGGENISAREVEEVLGELPDVAEVAVVGIPDARLGEIGCAVVRPSAGAPVTLSALVEALRDRGLAPHKWPERLHLVSEPFPRTVTGKVRKIQLRQSALDGLAAPAAGPTTD